MTRRDLLQKFLAGLVTVPFVGRALANLAVPSVPALEPAERRPLKLMFGRGNGILVADFKATVSCYFEYIGPVMGLDDICRAFDDITVDRDHVYVPVSRPAPSGVILHKYRNAIRLILDRCAAPTSVMEAVFAEYCPVGGAQGRDLTILDGNVPIVTFQTTFMTYVGNGCRKGDMIVCDQVVFVAADLVDHRVGRQCAKSTALA